jgi:hypothetical protein
MIMDFELLHEDRLRDWSARLDLPEEAVGELAEVAMTVREDADLLERFCAFYEKTTLRGEWHKEWSEFPVDPGIQERMGPKTNQFYLLAYLAALPHVEAEYIRRGIDLSIFDATMQDFPVWLIHAHDVTGEWRYNQFPWIWRHITCELFRLGRMQYMLVPFQSGVIALCNKASGKIHLLADPDQPLRDDGYAYGAGDLPASGEPWTALREETEAGWRGNPVNPLGFVLREPVFLPRMEWEIALQKDDTILDMHIPRGDSFCVEDCRESLAQAWDFFARYSPDRPFKAGFCHTWFFSPQLQKMLSPESNIVRFQREFYLYPFAGKKGFLWTYVFGEKYPELATAPRNTRLQRAAAEWLEAGNEIFDLPGVMFHKPEAWGTQPYMRDWGV